MMVEDRGALGLAELQKSTSNWPARRIAIEPGRVFSTFTRTQPQFFLDINAPGAVARGASERSSFRRWNLLDRLRQSFHQVQSELPGADGSGCRLPTHGAGYRQLYVANKVGEMVPLGAWSKSADHGLGTRYPLQSLSGAAVFGGAALRLQFGRALG